MPGFINIFLISTLLLLLSACGPVKRADGDEPVDLDIKKCVSPRPQICTREYRPVCGFMQDGNHKTYGNACDACARAAVTGYSENPCK